MTATESTARAACPTTAEEGSTRLNKVMTISWQTAKTETGFTFYVTGTEYQKTTWIFKGTRTTRPQAVTAAKKAARYFRAIQSKLA